MPTPAHVYRRRRLAALGAIALPVAGLGAAIGAGDERRQERPAAVRAAARPVPPAPPELPRGGRRLFPDWRVVAYYGAPQDRELGVLGIGGPDRATRRLLRRARAYRRKTRPVLPALELIATIVTADAGPDGRHRMRQSDAVIRRYLRAARRHRALLVLDVQPGRADFLAEARRLERWLREPDVSLALDPEWRMGPGEVPGRVIGSVSSREINAVSEWLSRIVRRHRLPEKLLLVHQFTDDMIRDKRRVKRRPGLAMTFNVDGFGGQAVKKAKYRQFTHPPMGFHDGFKLFFREDTDLMTPRQVLAMNPPPDVVVYE